MKAVVFNLRVSEDERALLDQFAAGLRVTPTEALRMAIRVLARYPKIRGEVALRDLEDRQREI